MCPASHPRAPRHGHQVRRAFRIDSVDDAHVAPEWLCVTVAVKEIWHGAMRSKLSFGIFPRMKFQCWRRRDARRVTNRRRVALSVEGMLSRELHLSLVLLQAYILLLSVLLWHDEQRVIRIYNRRKINTTDPSNLSLGCVEVLAVRMGCRASHLRASAAFKSSAAHFVDGCITVTVPGQAALHGMASDEVRGVAERNCDGGVDGRGAGFAGLRVGEGEGVLARGEDESQPGCW
ncbi:hypothetical protein C8R46DRAFT_1031388 [Mycena filopes]|nr:hypothetical protein C8R46DRAFT_1031388 [Mycena filopes]